MSSVSSLAEKNASIAWEVARAGRQRAHAWLEGSTHPHSKGLTGPTVAAPLIRVAGYGWVASWWLRGWVAWLIELVAGWLAAVLEAFEKVLGWSLSVLALPVLAVLQVPYAGRALHWILTICVSLIALVVKIPDGLLALIGVLPEKTLRVGFISLCEGRVALDKLEKDIREAGVVLREQANIRLLIAGPDGSIDRSLSWLDLRADEITVYRAGQGAPMEVGCLGTAFTEDLADKGARFGWAILRADRFGLWRRLLGAGAPLSVLLVDSVQSGKLLGCSLGPLVDYVTLNAGDPRCLAHELGHACSLWHVGKKGNLMHHHCGGRQLSRWQIALLRMSRHVSYV